MALDASESFAAVKGGVGYPDLLVYTTDYYNNVD